MINKKKNQLQKILQLHFISKENILDTNLVQKLPKKENKFVQDTSDLILIFHSDLL